MDHLSNSSPEASHQIYQSKAAQASGALQLCRRLCSALSVCVRFSHATACTVVSSTNSFPALGLADSSLPVSLRAPVQSRPSAFAEPSVRVHTYSTYLHCCSPGNPRTACWQSVRGGGGAEPPLNNSHLCVCRLSCAFHFLVVLCAVTYRRGETPAHWLFRTDTPGGRVSFPKSSFLLLRLPSHRFLLCFSSDPAPSLIWSIPDWQQAGGKDWCSILSTALQIPASSD